MECNLNNGDSDEGEISECEEKLMPSITSSSKVPIKKQKREVIIRTFDKKNETLVITQKVDTKKQNKTPNNLKPYKKVLLGPEYLKHLVEINMTVADRIVPDCYRLECKKKAPKRNKHLKRLDKKHRNKTELKNYGRKPARSKNKTKKISKKIKLDSQCKGSISLLNSNRKCNSPYEDVSSDSFTSRSDGELDTLIKRTKEREKHMTVSCNFLCDRSRCSSSHSVIDISSEDSLDSKGSSDHPQAASTINDHVHDLTHSPAPDNVCEENNILDIPLDKIKLPDSMPDVQNKYGIIHDIPKDKTKLTKTNLYNEDTNYMQKITPSGPDTNLTYYHYYNVTNINESNFKIESNNNIYYEQYTFHSKKSHNG